MGAAAPAAGSPGGAGALTAARPAQLLLRATRERAARYAAARSHYLRWLPVQQEWHKVDTRAKLLRLGNQWGGKTTAGLAEVDWRCTGRHPYLSTRTPPIEAWVICASWSQSVAIQRKFWDLCDRAELADDTVFDPVRGFKGKNPAVQYRNGSIVRFKTTQQGGLNLAGATIHVALIDEPTEQRIFEEVRKRLLRTGGVLLMTLTPINGPTEYLREIAEKGGIVDVWRRLAAEELVPVGAELPMRLEDGRRMDAAWIEQTRAETLHREEPVVVDGEWEVRTKGRAFTAFDPRPTGGAHIRAEVGDGDWILCLGIDHGHRDFKQVSLLVAVDVSDRSAPRIHVLDEVASEGDTLPRDDARATLAMLARWGLEWGDLRHVHGDKPHLSSQDRRIATRKSNREFFHEVRRLLGIPSGQRLTPEIRQAKTGSGGGRGSIDRGVEWLHRCMLRPGGFGVHPDCKRLIAGLEKWDYTDSDFKDPIDALRYATWPYAIRDGGSRGNATVYVY